VSSRTRTACSTVRPHQAAIGRRRTCEETRHGAFFRREKAQAELHALLRELASSEAPQTYVGCVGAVAATVGGTLLGSQQVSTQVRAHRMGMVSAGRVATAVGGLGLVVLGGAAVSAAVCLPELVR
jgi:hypothetical protein